MHSVFTSALNGSPAAHIVRFFYSHHGPFSLSLIQPTSALDDGFKDGYNNVQEIDLRTTVSKDLISSRFWDLAHAGGVYTPEHHDADGLLTYVQVITGGKFWAAVEPKGYRDATTRAQIFRLCVSVMPSNDDQESWLRNWEKAGGTAYVIDVQPGDVV